MINEIRSLLLVFAIPLLGICDNNSAETETSVFYIDAKCVHPGQIRFSNYVVKEKIEEHLDKGDVFRDKQSQSWTLKYFDKTSLFPLSNALPVVLAPYGYVLVDGHHHFLTNLAFDGTRIPISVIAER